MSNKTHFSGLQAHSNWEDIDLLIIAVRPKINCFGIQIQITFSGKKIHFFFLLSFFKCDFKHF